AAVGGDALGAAVGGDALGAAVGGDALGAAVGGGALGGGGRRGSSRSWWPCETATATGWVRRTRRTPSKSAGATTLGIRNAATPRAADDRRTLLGVPTTPVVFVTDR